MTAKIVPLLLNVNTRLTVVLFFVIGLCLSDRPSFAAGEIININEKYNLVFTDLTSHVLKRGDVVKVTAASNDVVYLSVVDVSPILSKLGPVETGQMKTDPEGLKKLSIGNPVEKISSDSPAPAEKAAGPAVAAVNNDALTAQIRALETSVASCTAERKTLENKYSALEKQMTQLAVERETFVVERRSYENQINDQKKLVASLKDKLEHMKEILKDNGQ